MSSVADDPVAMSCSQAVLEEFQSDRVGLTYNRPSDFVTCQWPCRQRWYLVYRVVASVLLTSWAIGDVAYETHEFYGGTIGRWFIFATNWSFLLLTLTTIFQALISAIFVWKHHWIVDPQYCRSMPVVLRMQWAMQALAYNSAVVVTAAYWLFISLFADEPLLKTSMSEMKHSANTLYVLVDLMVIAAPVRLFHMFYPIGLGSCYVIFNSLYFLQEGTIYMAHAPPEASKYAYNFMNWKKPVEAIITCVLGVFLSVLAQITLFLFFRLRVCIWQKVCDGDASRMESELQNIVLSHSSSYNTIDDAIEDKKTVFEKTID